MSDLTKLFDDPEGLSSEDLERMADEILDDGGISYRQAMAIMQQQADAIDAKLEELLPEGKDELTDEDMEIMRKFTADFFSHTELDFGPPTFDDMENQRKAYMKYLHEDDDNDEES